VHEVVRRALIDALGQGRAPELQLTPPGTSIQEPIPQAIPGVLGGGVYRGPGSPTPTMPRPGDVPGPFGGQAAQAPAASDAALHIKPMIPLGQFRDTFIIAVDDEGIAIVDQHVAHERVLFERMLERLMRGRLDSQRLLVPLLIELPPGGRQALVAHATELDRFGFELEEFGGDSLRVSALPALISADEATAALRTLADDLEGLDAGARVEEALRRIAATTACHAAVKANDRLTIEKMAHILEELRQTAYSTVCPHGRPVMLRLTRREVERNFQRI
jgi:DNA mismatch repair protein MutL